MKSYGLCIALLSSVLALAPNANAQGSPDRAATRTAAAQICAACIREHMNFLASDALRGRGSGTPDEYRAATYAATQFKEYGLEPAGDDRSYLQNVTLLRRILTGAPQLRVQTTEAGAPHEITYTHGREMLVLHLGAATFAGPLQRIELSHEETVKRGAVVLVSSKDPGKARQVIPRLVSQGAVAVVLPASQQLLARWESLGKQLPELPLEFEGAASSREGHYNVLALSHDASAALAAVPEGTIIRLETPVGPLTRGHTWNAIARLSGNGPQQHTVILLTAHLDHLGIGAPVNGDDIYNGADDDASGTTAVLELARFLAQQPKRRRTVIFALFGSEETGGRGSMYFREHPPVPLTSIAAYLEFEMIGRRDPAVPEDTLWLTGWERSNLGPELANHGAHLVGDPHPDQEFFRRSDNYVFARRGIVAQTISSYGLHPDYHQPGDDLAHIDFQHMDHAIQSMLKPILWLVNSDFVPHWNQGGQP